MVISPDLEKYLGVSNSQIDRFKKPTAIYKKYLKLEEEGNDIVRKVEKLFNLLVNPQNLRYKISNPDGSEWQYKDENSISIPKATYDEFKNIIKEKLNLYNGIYGNFSGKQIQKLKDLFDLEKNSKTQQRKHLNKWLQKEETT